MHGSVEIDSVLIASKRGMHLGVVYKPSVKDVHLLKPIKKVVDFLSNRNGKHCLPDDFNLLGVDLNNMTANSSYQQEKFVRLFRKRGYYQMVSENTRGENVLDLIFQDDQSLVQNVHILPKFSNHNVAAAIVRIHIKPMLPLFPLFK